MSKFEISSGKTIIKPFNKIWIILGVVVTLLIIFWQFITYDTSLFNFGELGVIFKQLFTPKNTNLEQRTWADYFEFMWTLREPLWITIQMSLGGTIIGSIFAIPVAIFASRNIFKNKYINAPFRFLMNLIRTIPLMLLVIIGVAMVGTGVLSGILGYSVFSFGIMAKMFYEVIETADMNPFEALESTGANKLQAFSYAIVPQVFISFVSFLFYIFELNIRASAILGFVGINGIGEAISVNNLYNYDRVGATVIVLFVFILSLQLINSYIRGKLE
ncbi:MAG: phosphate/phosphonate ABC transporter permease [Candidatus Izemoplasmatales bacterium]|jgi:phosphonate transport system permease protein|nr:phosphate/phosphonate ABC transporter permease [Candidatus Izemoplasmatales bacterium]